MNMTQINLCSKYPQIKYLTVYQNIEYQNIEVVDGIKLGGKKAKMAGRDSGSWPVTNATTPLPDKTTEAKRTEKKLRDAENKCKIRVKRPCDIL